METDFLDVLVIDNEQQSLQQLVDLLQSNPLISEITTASSTDEAILKIINSSPGIILVHYPPKGNTEKELFELVKTKLPDSSLAFVCDTKDFAKTAIQNGIYKYLLNPVTDIAIKNLIDAAFEKKLSNIQNRLDQAINSNTTEVRLRFLTNSGYVIFSPEELLFCKAIGYYTELHLTNKKKEISHLSLLKVEEKMNPYGFLRISRTHLINPKYIKRIFKKGNIVTLAFDGVEYELKAGKNHVKLLSNFDTE
jgi:two-component system LytT family response regulator